jgi:Cu/Ag efflux pump CusA
MIERIINSVLKNRGLVLIALLGVIGLGVVE